MPEIVSNIVEVCVFRLHENEPHYLVLRRSEGDKIYPGLWQLISGSVEVGEKAMEAAVREMKEEIGLSPFRFWVVPLINSFHVPSEDIIHFTTVFAAEVDSHAELSLSAEHQAVRWCTFDEANRLLVWPGQKNAVRMVHEFILGSAGNRELTAIKEIPFLERKQH